MLTFIGRCKNRIVFLILALFMMSDFFCMFTGDIIKAADNYDIDGIISKCMSNYPENEISSLAGTTDGDWIAICAGRLKLQYGKEYINKLNSYVKEQYAANSYGLNRNKATEWHRISLVYQAFGHDPANIIISDGSKIDLIKDGVFVPLTGTPWKQGINGAIFALIAIDSFGYEDPEDAVYKRNDLIEYILSEELQNGGYALNGNAPDPDITAMAVTALAPYYEKNTLVKESIDRCINVLSNMQQDDGDYSSYGSLNAESTSQVIIALSSLGIDIKNDKRFITTGGKTLIDGLMKYYINAEGKFSHIYGEQSNHMATSQAMCALISYKMNKEGKGRFYDFTVPNEPEKTQIPAVVTNIPDRTHTPATKKPESTGIPATHQPESTPAVVETTKPVVKTTPEPTKRPYKLVKKHIKVVKKSKDIVLKRDKLYISSKEIKKIIGKKYKVRVEAATLEGRRCVVTIIGKNINKPDNITINISTKSKLKKCIREISEKPFVMNIVCENYDGPFLLEYDTGIDDGQYLLMKYENEQAEFVNKVSVENGLLKSIFETDGVYFLAKKVLVNKEELKEEELKEEVKKETIEENEKEDQEEIQAVIKSEDQEDIQADVKSEQKPDYGVIALVAAFVILISGLYYSRRKKAS